jgi:hypothetical protein
MPLSPHEARILAAIEEDLREEDPALDAALTEEQPVSAATRQVRLWVRHVVLLTVALFALVLVHSLGSELGPAASILFTVLLIVPWIVSVLRTGTGHAALNRTRTGSIERDFTT